MSTETSLSIEERVAAGAAWLDEHKAGWERGISLERLDLMDPCLCVLGQVYQNYWIAVTRFFEDDTTSAARFGFDAFRGEDDSAFEDLDATWRRTIEARRVAS